MQMIVHTWKLLVKALFCTAQHKLFQQMVRKNLLQILLAELLVHFQHKELTQQLVGCVIKMVSNQYCTTRADISASKAVLKR